MENKDTIENLARTFKIFGDATRIKIMYTMLDREICVQDIAKNLEMTQSAISHQLSILKGARLIKSRKDGKEVYIVNGGGTAVTKSIFTINFDRKHKISKCHLEKNENIFVIPTSR